MELREKLILLRKNRGLTQEELAKALFVSRTAISKWEAGRGLPNPDSLVAMAKFFDVTVDDLLGKEELSSLGKQAIKQKRAHLRDLVMGLLHTAALLLFLLPLFGQEAGDSIEEVGLLALSGCAPYLKAIYVVTLGATVLFGILRLTLQTVKAPVWLKCKDALSLILNVFGAALFALSRQPYAGCLFLIFFIIDVLFLTKHR